MGVNNLLIDQRATCAILTINRPNKLNALNRETIQELHDAFATLEKDKEVKVIIITGSGEKAFVAGADIAEFADFSAKEGSKLAKNGQKLLFDFVENLSKPVIAAVNGFALGGGLELAIACHFRLASDNAKMGLPEVFLSLVPGGGGTQRLIQRIGINRAKEMLYTGSQYTASDLFQWGIVNHLHSDGKFEAEVMNFTEKLARRPSGAIKHLKRLAHLSLAPLAFPEKVIEEGKAVTELFYGEEAQKAIKEFMAKSKINLLSLN